MLRRFNAPDGAAYALADEIAEQARQAADVGIDTLTRYFTENGPRAVPSNEEIVRELDAIGKTDR